MEGIKLTVKQRGIGALEYVVPRGQNLRAFLLEQGHLVYAGKNQILNCHGFGLCGTCWVEVREQGGQFQRRSCQIQCYQDFEIQLQ